jgi:hypothetical protein
MGLDDRNVEGASERFVTFAVDGQSLIGARLSNVSAGHVRMCLWQGDLVTDKTCRTVHNGGIQLPVFDTGQTPWTLTLLGTDAGITPTADLTLDFNANAPSVTLDSFRFNGTDTPSYNGFVAEIDAQSGGDFHLDASFGGGAFMSHLVIERLGSAGGVVYDQTNASVPDFGATQHVSNGHSYRVTLSNPDANEIVPVFVKTTLTWP